MKRRKPTSSNDFYSIIFREKADHSRQFEQDGKSLFDGLFDVVVAQVEFCLDELNKRGFVGRGERCELVPDGIEVFNQAPEAYGFDGDLSPFEGCDAVVVECFVDGHGSGDEGGESGF